MMLPATSQSENSLNEQRILLINGIEWNWKWKRRVLFMLLCTTRKRSKTAWHHK